MKWKRPCHGNLRIKKKFLWFPKTIKQETRWFEVATWEQLYHYGSWLNSRWIDE